MNNHILRSANTQLRKGKKKDTRGLLHKDYNKGKVRKDR